MKATQSFDRTLASSNLACDAQDAENEGNVEQAIALYKRALMADPDNDAALINLSGLLVDKLGNCVGARKLLRRAIKINKGSAIAHYNMALSWHISGRTDKAITCYRTALVCNADTDTVHDDARANLLAMWVDAFGLGKVANQNRPKRLTVPSLVITST